MNLSKLRVLATVSGALLMADQPGWSSKPTSDWSVEDARQVLDDSPWARTVEATILPVPAEAQRRESGYMGERHGIGYDGVDDRPAMTMKDRLVLAVKGHDPRGPAETSYTLLLRWETALPVRAAEKKAASLASPPCPGDGYCIAVYNVPGAPPGGVKGSPAKLGNAFKAEAFLSRPGKKDVKPVSVEVLEGDSGLVLAYRFPPSAEITRKDHYVQFRAQIGRLAFAQIFALEPMVFHGKLEL